MDKTRIKTMAFDLLEAIEVHPTRDSVSAAIDALTTMADLSAEQDRRYGAYRPGQADMT